MSQKNEIYNHLKVFHSISPLEALYKYNCFRLGDVIFKLRKEGHKIETNINAIGKHYAIYVMKGDDHGA